MEKQTKRNRKNKLIQDVETIANVLKKSDMSPQLGKAEQDALDHVMDFLGVNKVQAFLFTVVFMLSFKERRVYIENISEFLGSSNFRIAMLVPELEQLAGKKLIQYYRSAHSISDKDDTIHELSFCFSRKIMDAVLLEDNSRFEKIREVDMITLLEIIYKLVEDRSDETITYNELLQEVDELLLANKKLAFVQNLDCLNLENYERVFLLYVCREILKGDDDVDLISALEKIISDARTRFQFRRSLVMGHNILIDKDILTLSDGMFRSDRDISLTDHGMDMLFDKELKFLRTEEKKDKNLLLHKNIKEMPMFYEPPLRSQLDELVHVLEEKNYQRTLKRLKSKGMPEGMAILLHGPPGTGKTATTYQIARQTGRDIMEVDISDTKSMWFGESEKRIKKVFTDYRNMLDKGEKAPILLFNECDAVFGTRKRIGNSPVDQTENTIQNIILQSMEDLKGILIATTNLTHNLDRAFQRRFLWKILLEPPGPENRKQIWLSKLPFLKEEVAMKLAGQFNFSGGIIENIARKAMMHEVLQGKAPAIDQILSWCREEDSLSGIRAQIGFSGIGNNY
jgi:AAA+ superfamily predicted ATPase